MSPARFSRSRRMAPGAPTPRRGTITGLCVLAMLSVSCAGRQQSSTSECVHPPGSLTTDVAAMQLEGTFQLTLVAREGEKAGSRSAGRLQLMVQDSSRRVVGVPGGVADTTASAPLYGTADIDVEAVGALRLGDLSSRDPMRPGVLVLERRTDPASPPSIVLRLGSIANQRDVLRFDGGYTALHVQEITEGGFRGTWASGTMGPQAEGYFCAVRIDDS